MKPRSLFDANAWVDRPFKPAALPQTPIVRLPKETKAEKPIKKPVPFPSPDRSAPYKTGCSPAVRQSIQAVADIAGVPMAAIVSPRRDLETVIVRQVGIWIARRFTNRSLVAIASEVGDRDHTTIMHSIKRIEQTIADNGIQPAEDTPEAWTAALLGQHRLDRKQRWLEHAKRQPKIRRQRYERQKALRAARRAARKGETVA
jgi:hypothetical protein